jgi:hypothetical protein
MRKTEAEKQLGALLRQGIRKRATHVSYSNGLGPAQQPQMDEVQAESMDQETDQEPAEQESQPD